MSLKSHGRIYWSGIKLLIIIPGDFRFWGVFDRWTDARASLADRLRPTETATPPSRWN